MMDPMAATYVLVPGSFSNALGWAPMQRELGLRGLRSVAVDLPGRGFAAPYPVAYQAPQDLAALATAPSARAGATMAGDVAEVVEVVRRAAEHGPVVLVAHSRGGLSVTGAANAVPDLIDHLVYVSAWCCVTATPVEYDAGPENAESELSALGNVLAADPAELGALRVNWRTADPALLEPLKSAILADVTDAEFLAYLNTLEPDESLDAGEELAQAATWGRIPRTYVRLSQDRAMPPALQDRFIREADALTPDNPFAVHTLPSSHAAVLVRPGECAEILAGLARV